MLWTVIAAVVLVTGGWWIFRPVNDPTYQGQRASGWFAFVMSPNVKEREAAQKAFREMGAAALPFLIGRLRFRESPWTKKYQQFYSSRAQWLPRWVRSHLPIPHMESAEMIRSRALIALQSLGDSAKPAVPDVARALSDESPFVRRNAADVLGRLGPNAQEALPALLEALRTNDIRTADDGIRQFQSEAVASALAKLAPALPEIVPALTRMLRQDDRLKIIVLQILTTVGPTATEACDDIGSILSSTNARVRLTAARAEWAVGPSRRLALRPHLYELGRSNERRIRESAGLLLASIPPITREGAVVLTSILSEGDDSTCWSLLVELAGAGRGASNTVPAVIKALDNDNPRVVAKAAEVLGVIGDDNPSVRSTLEKAKQHPYTMVREAAELSLRKIEPQTK